MKFLFLSLSALLLSLPLAAAAKDPVWVSMGQQAYQELLAIEPGLASPYRMNRPTGAQRADGSAATETVHVVRVNSAVLEELGGRVHRNLHHCGGYMVHDSLTEALAMLQPVPARQQTTGVTYTITHQANVGAMLHDLNSQRMEDVILDLSSFHNRYYDSTYGADAADWLFNHWQTLAAGRSDISLQKVYFDGYAMPNVMLTIEGTTRADEQVILGAHLDSINRQLPGDFADLPAPGADDDASGIASVTEILAVLLDHGVKPRRSLTFVGYSGEETGLRGSGHMAAQYAANKVDVAGVLQLDMTLYQGSADDIYIITDYTDSGQNQFLANLAATYLPSVTVGYNYCTYSCSDHASWTAYGYPASFPFEARINPTEDNPGIHSIFDTYDHAGNSIEHGMQFTGLGYSYAVELAGDVETIFVNGMESPRF